MDQTSNWRDDLGSIIKSAAEKEFAATAAYRDNENRVQAFCNGTVRKAFNDLRQVLERHNREVSVKIDNDDVSARIEVFVDGYNDRRTEFTYRIKFDITPTAVTAFTVVPVKDEESGNDDKRQLPIGGHESLTADLAYTEDQIIRDFLTKYNLYVTQVADRAWRKEREARGSSGRAIW